MLQTAADAESTILTRMVTTKFSMIRPGIVFDADALKPKADGCGHV